MTDGLELFLQSNIDMKIPRNINQYKIIKLIMESYSSVVCLCVQTDTKQFFAIKFIPIQLFRQNPDQINILRMINHPHIINVIETFQYPNEDPKFQAKVMPKAINDLFQYVVDSEPVSEHIACVIIHDLLDAVNFLHSNNIWHRNITPEQILIKEESKDGPFIQLSGFQFAKHINTKEITDNSFGSKNYAAIELLDFNGNNVSLKQNATYSNKIDIWSVGMIAFMLLTRRNSFDIISQDGIESLRNGEIPFDLIDEHVSSCAKDLIRHMLQFDPDERFSAAQALAHPWFNPMH